MTMSVPLPRAAPLTGYALFAAMLAAAGLPIYLHAPKFYADTYGVSLTALGAVLFGLRLIDVVQDPGLGWLAARLRRHLRVAVPVAAAVMAGGMLGLFSLAPPIAPLAWFALMLMLVFSAFSFLTICFYAQGVTNAGALGGHVRLARWREAGALLGICGAAAAPVLLPGGYAAFALAFVGLALAATVAQRTEWRASPVPNTGFAPVLRDPVARRLLLIAGLNAAPVAVSSTLFLFFVADRLEAPGAEGSLLILFFLSAAAGAPLWGTLAERRGARPTLMVGMALSIAAFALVPLLGPGDVAGFALICAVSGIALGADMTLLPALFAARMERVAPGAAPGWGLWAFVTKFTLALAALLLLPILDAAGYIPGTDNPASALTLLSILYAALPCLLKAAALGLLALTDPEDMS
ncbi:MFS transporter [Ruegeria sp. PrR005]